MKKDKDKEFRKSLGYKVLKCPICGRKTFEYISYSEYGWGIVEQHGYCSQCGYFVEQAYSPVHDCFIDNKKGYKSHNGTYVPKDVKKHKRVRRKLENINIETNPKWARYI